MNAIDRLFTEPLAILPAAVPVLISHFIRSLRALQAKETPAPPAAAATAAAADWLGDYVVQRPEMTIDDGIATISVVGPLGFNLTTWEKRNGATDYADVSAELATAQASPSVRGVLLKIASPGGSAVGCLEVGMDAAAVGGVKPIVAFIGGQGCSAAFAIAAGADAIIAPRSAIVASIGTIATFADYSALYAEIGIRIELITATQSDLKSTWSPLAPMTRDQREDAQRQIDSINAAFLGWISSRRPGVEAKSMRGQWFSAADALPLGLVDQLGSEADARAALEALVKLRS